MTKLIINVETGEALERELNKAEKDQQKIDAVKAQQLRNELQTEAEAKATARQAILDRLGLTADEAALILG